MAVVWLGDERAVGASAAKSAEKGHVCGHHDAIQGMLRSVSHAPLAARQGLGVMLVTNVTGYPLIKPRHED